MTIGSAQPHDDGLFAVSAERAAETVAVLEWVKRRELLDNRVALDMWSPVLADDTGWPVSSVDVLTGWTEDWSRSAQVVVVSAAEAATRLPGWRELVAGPLDGGVSVWAPVTAMAPVQAIVAGTPGITVTGYLRDAAGELKHWQDQRPQSDNTSPPTDPWQDEPAPLVDARTMADLERHSAQRMAMIQYISAIAESHGDHWWVLEHEWLDALTRRPDGTFAGHVFDASPTDLDQDLEMGGYMHTAAAEWERLVVSGRLDRVMVWATPEAAESLRPLIMGCDERVRLLSLSPSAESAD